MQVLFAAISDAEVTDVNFYRTAIKSMQHNSVPSVFHDAALSSQVCLLYHCSVGKNLFLFRHRAKLAGLPKIIVQSQGGAEEGHEVKFVNGTAIQFKI